MHTSPKSDPVTAAIEFNTGDAALDQLLKRIDTELTALLRNNHRCIRLTIRVPGSSQRYLYLVGDSGSHPLFHSHTENPATKAEATDHRRSRREVLQSVYTEGRTSGVDAISVDVIDRVNAEAESPVLNDTQLARIHRENDHQALP